MTSFDIMVPALALLFAACGTIWLRHEGRKLDRYLERERRKKHHPAE